MIIARSVNLSRFSINKIFFKKDLTKQTVGAIIKPTYKVGKRTEGRNQS